VEPLTGWGEELGAPSACHLTKLFRAGFEPFRASAIKQTKNRGMKNKEEKE